MSAAEFREWLARETVDPLPDPWLQTGQVCAATLAPHSKRTPKPGDFIPRASFRPKRQTAAEIHAALMSLSPQRPES